MEKLTEQTLAALLAQASLKPKEGDLERFGKVIDAYVAGLALIPILHDHRRGSCRRRDRGLVHDRS